MTFVLAAHPAHHENGTHRRPRWVLRQFDLHFWNSAPFDLAYLLFTAFTNGVALAATIVVLDAIWRGFGVASGISAWCAVALPLGTWLLPYGVVTNNHGVSAFLLACLAWLLMQIDFGRGDVRITGALGLTLGLPAAIEVIPIVSFVPLLGAFFGGLAVPLLLHAALNIPLTGDLLPGGFHSELFVYEGIRLDASTLSGNMNHSSPAMFIDYTWKALITEKGYFSYAPILLVGLLTGIPWLAWPSLQQQSCSSSLSRSPGIPTGFHRRAQPSWRGTSTCRRPRSWCVALEGHKRVWGSSRSRRQAVGHPMRSLPTRGLRTHVESTSTRRMITAR